jgi:preprotein translocase subunit SecD
MLSARVKRFWLGALCLLASQLLVLAATSEPLTLDVRGARADLDKRTGQPVLHITLSGDGLARFTSENVGRQIELRIDGKTVLTTVIREPILGAGVQIVGPSLDEAHAIAGRLATGAAKVQVEIVPK